MSTPNVQKDFLQLVSQVNEFTGLEVLALVVWLDLALNGHKALARDVLQAGLDAEHWKAEISEDPLQVTVEQSQEYQRRLKRFQDLVTQAEQTLSTRY